MLARQNLPPLSENDQRIRVPQMLNLQQVQSFTETLAMGAQPHSPAVYPIGTREAPHRIAGANVKDDGAFPVGSQVNGHGAKVILAFPNGVVIETRWCAKRRNDTRADQSSCDEISDPSTVHSFLECWLTIESSSRLGCFDHAIQQ